MDREPRIKKMQNRSKFSIGRGPGSMLQLYNTMSRQKEPFQPKDGRVVKMFSCGPSIYAPPHIGNYRTFIWQDLLQRYLDYLGYEVKRGISLTDVEDKAIEEAQERGITVGELTGEIAARLSMKRGGSESNCPRRSRGRPQVWAGCPPDPQADRERLRLPVQSRHFLRSSQV